MSALRFGPPKKGWPTFTRRHDDEEAPLGETYFGTTYVSGPMRGHPQCNFPAFDAAAEVLRKADYIVISPADHDRDKGFDFSRSKACDNDDLAAAGFPLSGAIMWDLGVIIERATDIHLLPGWEQSSGARLELEAARFARINVWLPTPLYERTGKRPAWYRHQSAT